MFMFLGFKSWDCFLGFLWLCLCCHSVSENVPIRIILSVSHNACAEASDDINQVAAFAYIKLFLHIYLVLVTLQAIVPLLSRLGLYLQFLVFAGILNQVG